MVDIFLEMILFSEADEGFELHDVTKNKSRIITAFNPSKQNCSSTFKIADYP